MSELQEQCRHREDSDQEHECAYEGLQSSEKPHSSARGGRDGGLSGAVRGAHLLSSRLVVSSASEPTGSLSRGPSSLSAKASCAASRARCRLREVKIRIATPASSASRVITVPAMPRASTGPQ